MAVIASLAVTSAEPMGTVPSFSFSWEGSGIYFGSTSIRGLAFGYAELSPHDSSPVFRKIVLFIFYRVYGLV